MQKTSSVDSLQTNSKCTDFAAMQMKIVIYDLIMTLNLGTFGFVHTGPAKSTPTFWKGPLDLSRRDLTRSLGRFPISLS